MKRRVYGNGESRILKKEGLISGLDAPLPEAEQFYSFDNVQANLPSVLHIFVRLVRTKARRPSPALSKRFQYEVENRTCEEIKTGLFLDCISLPDPEAVTSIMDS